MKRYTPDFLIGKTIKHAEHVQHAVIEKGKAMQLHDIRLLLYFTDGTSCCIKCDYSGQREQAVAITNEV